MSQLYHQNYSRRRVSGRLFYRPKSRLALILDWVFAVKLFGLKKPASLPRVFWLYHCSGLALLILLTKVMETVSFKLILEYSALINSFILAYGFFTSVLVWKETNYQEFEFWGWMARSVSFISVFLLSYNQIMAFYQLGHSGLS